MSHEKNSKPVVSFDQSTYRKGNFKHKHHGRGEGPEKEGRKHEKRHKHHFGRQYEYSEEQTRRADSFLTHPIWGLVSFIFIIWMIFFFTFRLGAYPQAGIEWLMDKGALFIQILNFLVIWTNSALLKV